MSIQVVSNPEEYFRRLRERAAEEGTDIHTMRASMDENVPVAEVTTTQRQTAKTRSFFYLYGAFRG